MALYAVSWLIKRSRSIHDIVCCFLAH